MKQSFIHTLIIITITMYKYTQMLSQAYRDNNAQIEINHTQHKRNCIPRKYQNNLTHAKIPIQSQKSYKKNQNIYLSSKQTQKIINKKLEVPNVRVIQPSRDRNNNDHQQRVQEISNKYSHQCPKATHSNSSNYQMYKQAKSQIGQSFQRNPDLKTRFQRTSIQMGGNDKNLQKQLANHNRSIPYPDQMTKGKVKEEISLRLQNFKRNEEKKGAETKNRKYDYGCMPQAGTHSFGQKPSNSSSQTMSKLSLLQERIKQTIEPYKNL